TISQHLKELKNAGIIQGAIDGVKVCYCIEPKTWKLLNQLFGDFMRSYVDPKGCC
ncbi:MAG: transcriptional regulator, partial [Pedobacter agri]